MRYTFAALVVAQAIHSMEEYIGRLYDVFPPARFVSGLLSSDRQRGFIVFNAALVAFGAWCALWPVRRRWPSAPTFAWIWVSIELLNGVGHPLWSLMQGGYTPGLASAPCLLALAVCLAVQLSKEASSRR